MNKKISPLEREEKDEAYIEDFEEIINKIKAKVEKHKIKKFVEMQIQKQKCQAPFKK